MYKSLIRPLLFMMDPERVHHLSFLALRLGLAFEPLARLFGAFYTWQSPQLERELFGLRFRNPLGLAAGFDKDALLADKWKYLGFGFVEVGTVTPRPQAGNPKKRLFRLPEDRAIINRMGFNNAGVEAMARRLAKIDKGDLIIGANIGKNKDTPNEKATEDYLICFERLFDLVDYFVVNVSSPNTPGLRELQEKEPLTRLLLSLQERNQARAHPKPLLLKVAPDLTPLSTG
jgi:dihydroorotate dehydrogenase